VVSDLREIDLWRGEDSIKRLEQELSKMISPYKQIRDFNVFVEVDGKPLELAEISDKIRDVAPIRYAIMFDGSKLEVKGRARLDFFSPSTAKEAEQFALLVESDEGRASMSFTTGRTREEPPAETTTIEALVCRVRLHKGAKGHRQG